MPTSTSLVTNLPADFNTFGQGVDTSMAQLKGGSTGQVLSKTSATDMAFTWVTPTDQTPLTTKGDLFAFTTVDARLAVGADGTALVADSAQATGLAYKTPGVFNGLTTTGDTIYSSSGTTQARLPIGSTGQVLTVAAGVPSWATAATGGMTLLSTTTLSGATTTISSISGAYKQLIAFIELPQNATADGQFRIAPNGDTNLAYLVGVKIATTVYDVNGGYITTASTSNRSTTNFSTTLVIDNYTTTATLKPVQYYGWYAPTSGSGQFMSSGVYASASAVTSLVFSNSGGNLSSGTVYLYGVK